MDSIGPKGFSGRLVSCTDRSFILDSAQEDAKKLPPAVFTCATKTKARRSELLPRAEATSGFDSLDLVILSE